MLPPEVKRHIYRVIPFGLIWLIFGMTYTFLEWALFRGLSHEISTENPHHFGRTFLIRVIISFLFGLLIGTAEILYLSKLFHEKSFAAKILYKSLIYLAIIICFLMLGAAISYAVDSNTGFFTKRVWDNVFGFLFSRASISFEVYAAVVIGVSLFYTEVSESLGYGVLINFFTGKYHVPIEEERIFMFLDMKSSTTIAETLGHVRYFKMLREYYADLSGPIIKHAGEIYQYVGDEVIVSWTLKKGIQNSNCIRCFFSMKDALGKQARKYNDRFGLLPSFKAGLHLGKSNNRRNWNHQKRHYVYRRRAQYNSTHTGPLQHI
jgi:adenylate cyclase